jgi:pyruvate-formate lyase-activating enzyme
MPHTPRLPATIEIDGGSRTLASGLLVELVDALRRSRPGDLIAITSGDASVTADLETWARLTGNAIVGSTTEGAGDTRSVIRVGAVADEPREAERPIGSRLWLYTNFDCNLRCDYCCVRSSPTARRRELGAVCVRRIAAEAAQLGVREFFITGGEPFLLPDLDEIVIACTAIAQTTVLTNAMLFHGTRLDQLRRMPRSQVVLQISLDSPTPELHDRHRGGGSWARAIEGIRIARREGFRLRLAATVANDQDAARFASFLDAEGIPADDRVIRPIALRGFAEQGLALSRMDLVPEITITSEGVYWHPVGAEDQDLLVTRELFPLAAAFEAVRQAYAREREHTTRLARVFHCA